MNVLISSRSFGKTDSTGLELLKSAGLEPIFNPYGRTPTESELIELSKDVVGIIAGTEKITRKIMESAKSLKVISRYGVGLDNIDLKAAEDLGIIVRSTPDAPTQAVAELTLALILNLIRKISEMDRTMRTSKWHQLMGNLLSEKIIGIIGLGRIGKAFVRLIEPFGVKLLVNESNPDLKFVSRYGIELVPLKKLISQSDIITLHIPLTDETRNIINRDTLSLMKKNVLIINTARGGLLDESALIDALETKSIGGAAIDVFGIEPYNGRLIEFDNVILTPHIGSYTEETRKMMENETVENLINALKELKKI